MEEKVIFTNWSALKGKKDEEGNVLKEEGNNLKEEEDKKEELEGKEGIEVIPKEKGLEGRRFDNLLLMGNYDFSSILTLL